MRSGQRLASFKTLQAISDRYHADISELVSAAAKADAKDGTADRTVWTRLLERIFDDGEPDPNGPPPPPAEPEPEPQPEPPAAPEPDPMNSAFSL